MLKLLTFIHFLLFSLNTFSLASECEPKDEHVKEGGQRSEMKVDMFGKRISKNILVVVDNATIRMTTSRILERLGCTITTANEGNEALQIVQRKESDFYLVLTDIEMPNMDGIVLAQEIRKLKHMACVPIIAITASSEEGIKSKCIDYGIVHVIFKPATEIMFQQLLSSFQEKGGLGKDANLLKIGDDSTDYDDFQKSDH